MGCICTLSSIPATPKMMIQGHLYGSKHSDMFDLKKKKRKFHFPKVMLAAFMLAAFMLSEFAFSKPGSFPKIHSGRRSREGLMFSS